MRAAVLQGVGRAIELEERPVPAPQPGEAVVRVTAAGLNHRDLWIQKGMYAGLRFPIVLGSDGVGTVSSVGDPSQREWLGKRVTILPSLDWGASERFQDARTFRILGLPDDGCLAEYVKVPVQNLYAAPGALNDEEVAALPLAALTAWRALTARAKIEPGDNVLVTGAGGGAASFAIQIGKFLRANIYVTTSTSDKLARAISCGASGGALYTSPDWPEQMRAFAKGFDVIVDSAGGDGFGHLIDLCNPGGTIVFFGATNGNPSTVDLRRIFWKQLSLHGTTMGSPKDFQEMLAAVERGVLRPIVSNVFPLEDVDLAFKRYAAGEQFGKVVVRIQE